ncbi:MAG: hypothetical protein E6117_04095, partial [Finegoldia magna]|uniref:hypothetical protein n=1 Tax=Finegoldia magna TaxID=1260 RepID=UPI00290C6848
KYSSTNFILNSFVYFGIQKPLHPYSGFWGSGQRGVFLVGKERCVWNFTKFLTQNMLAIKSRNRFGEEFVITKNVVKERIVRKKLF